MALVEFSFSASRYLWQYPHFTDTQAESKTHISALTSLFGLGELSLKLNPLLNASGAICKKKKFISLFLTLMDTSLGTCGYHLVSV